MGGIIEHGAGIAGGAQAAAGVAQGAASGIQLGSELAARKVQTDRQRQQMRLLQEASDLEQSQRQAKLEWDMLVARSMGQDAPAEGGYGTPPPLRDFDTGETGIPGARRAPMGFSKDELGILARMAPDAREEEITNKKREIAAADLDANLQNLRGRLEMMGSAQGPYAPVEGGIQDPRIENVLQQAEAAVQLYEQGQITAAQAHQAVSSASNAVLEIAWQQQDAIETGTALFGKLDEVRRGNGDVLGGDERAVAFQEWIVKSWANGELDGKTARALSGLGPDGSDAALSWALGRAQGGAPFSHEQGGGLLVRRPGPQGGSVPRGTSPTGQPEPPAPPAQGAPTAGPAPANVDEQGAPPPTTRQAATPVDLFGAPAKAGQFDNGFTDDARRDVIAEILQAAVEGDWQGVDVLVSQQGLTEEQTAALSQAIADEVGNYDPDSFNAAKRKTSAGRVLVALRKKKPGTRTMARKGARVEVKTGMDPVANFIARIKELGKPAPNQDAETRRRAIQSAQAEIQSMPEGSEKEKAKAALQKALGGSQPARGERADLTPRKRKE